MHRLEGVVARGRQQLTGNFVTWLMVVACIMAISSAGAARAQQEGWLSGQDSPIHDSDLMIPFSGNSVAIENDDVRIAFDSVSGAHVEFVNKRTNWKIQQSADLAQSFRVFAPKADRSYNHGLRAPNTLTSTTK